MKNLTIIGGGPSALMLASQIDTSKYNVTLCEQKKTLGRKFLVAGEGGLNLTYNSSTEKLIDQYSPSEFMAPIINQFNNEDLMNWLNSLKVPTFIGSSQRVFPKQGIKPIEVLNKIVNHINAKDINVLLNTTWTGWDTNGNLSFENDQIIKSDITVFALGGASWKVTGSTGNWTSNFINRGLAVTPFRAANCAFSVNWHPSFLTLFEGKPLKNIAISFSSQTVKGELVISKFGLEGNAIYALSEKIQNKLQTQDHVTIHLDLKPSLSLEQIKTKYKTSKLSKTTDVLKNTLNLDKTAIALLKQYTNKETFTNPSLLCEVIKSVPIILHKAEEIDKAISTLGGIALDEIDANFQSKKRPNTYAIGEMLDWYAPTGGYLLQGCFSMGFVLAKHFNNI